MANQFLQKEVKKILEDARWPFPLNHAMAAANVFAGFKGENLKIFDVSKGSALCDYHVLATAQNPTQARAMVDELARQLRSVGTTPRTIEGYDSADWVLLDTGDVVFHVFQESARDIYGLDQVLMRHAQVPIPEEFYFGRPAQAGGKEDELKGFF